MDDEHEHECNVWWTICQCAFMEALKKVANGENPDLVYAEYYVNSEQEYI